MTYSLERNVLLLTPKLWPIYPSNSLQARLVGMIACSTNKSEVGRRVLIARDIEWSGVEKLLLLSPVGRTTSSEFESKLQLHSCGSQFIAE